MLKSRTEVTLGSAIKTLSDETIALKNASSVSVQAAGSVMDSLETSRVYRPLNSLIGIVPNGAVAEQVAEDLKGALDDKERQPSALVASVRGEMYQPEGAPATKGASASDSIQIIATHRDPQKAALIANAWARRYEAYVNGIYGNSAVAPFGEIDQQVNEARSKYDEAQERLLKYLSEENRVNELQRQIAEEEAIIARLRSGRATAITAVVSKQVSVTQELINAYLDNDANNRLLAFNKGQEAKRQTLAAWVDAEVAGLSTLLSKQQEVKIAGDGGDGKCGGG